MILSVMGVAATETAGRPMRADAARNRARILDAATNAFAADGPDVPLERIAGCASVGIGTLYRHFPDRQSLLTAVYREGLEGISEHGRQLLEADDPFAALRDWMTSHLAFNRTHQALAASAIINMLDNPDEEPPPCEEMKAVGQQLLDRAKAAGAVRDDVSVEDLARLVSAIALAADGAPEGGCVCGDRLFNVMLDGLRPRA